MQRLNIVKMHFGDIQIIGGVAVARLPGMWLLLRDYRSWRLHCISRTVEKAINPENTNNLSGNHRIRGYTISILDFGAENRYDISVPVLKIFIIGVSENDFQ